MSLHMPQTSPPFWRTAAIEAGAEWQKLRRSPGYVLPVICFPLVFYVVFGLLLAPKSGVEVSRYLLATYSAFGMISAVMFAIVTGVSYEREHGSLMLRRLAPASVGSYVLAKLFSAGCFALIVCLLLAIAAIGFGGVRMPLASLLGLWAVLLLGSVPFVLWAMVLGLRLPAQSAPNWLNLILLPIVLLGGLWVPTMAFPSWLQLGSQWLPTYQLGQLALAQVGMAQADWRWMVCGLGLMSILGWLAAARAWRHSGQQ